MPEIKQLFENNRKWAEGKLTRDPEFFPRLAKQQSPKYLWIGCSDSRIPANEILGLDPGEVFVHRNIANLFYETDLNCLSVLEFSINELKVEHVIVCGHYGCGGVAAAMESTPHGIVDIWISSIKELYKNENLESMSDEKMRYEHLVELNVKKQVETLAQSPIVQTAWNQKKKLKIHGWIYDLKTGLLKDLDCSRSS